MGRPKLPPGKAKTERIVLYLPPARAARYAQAARAFGFDTAAEWLIRYGDRMSRAVTRG